jgi:hypothetical protein
MVLLFSLAPQGSGLIKKQVFEGIQGSGIVPTVVVYTNSQNSKRINRGNAHVTKKVQESPAENNPGEPAGAAVTTGSKPPAIHSGNGLV